MNVPQETLNKIEQLTIGAIDNPVAGQNDPIKMRDDMKLYFYLVDN